MIPVVSAIIIRDKKILLVKKKDVWILPGGKIKGAEDHLECLVREIKEELNGTKIKENIEYYRVTFGKTPHKKYEILNEVYFAKIDGKLRGVSSEIKEYAWIKDTSKYNLSDITSEVIKSLKEEMYL